MWLTFVGTKWTPAMFDEAEKFAAAICPYKWDITASLVEQARARGLKVVAYTFRSGDEKESKEIGAEMHHYLYDLDVDGLFTDDPARFPRKK